MTKHIAQFDKFTGGNSNNNINKDMDNNDDMKASLKERLKKGPEKEDTYFRGYYIDKEIADAIDVLADGREKGYKSFLVNEVLKEYFRKIDLL